MRASMVSQEILKERTSRAGSRPSAARRPWPREVSADARNVPAWHPLAGARATCRRRGRGSLAALELYVVFVGARLSPSGCRRGPPAPLVTCPYAVSVYPAW